MGGLASYMKCGIVVVTILFYVLLVQRAYSREILFRGSHRIGAEKKSGLNLLSRNRSTKRSIQSQRFSTPKQLVIQFKRPLSADERQHVEQVLQVKLDRYVPHNAFIVYINKPDDFLAKSLDLKGLVDFVGHMRPEFKTGIQSESLQSLASNLVSIKRHVPLINQITSSTQEQDSVEMHVQLVDGLENVQNLVDSWNVDMMQLSVRGIAEAKLALVSNRKALLEIKLVHHSQELPLDSFQQSVLAYLTGQEEVSWIEYKAQHTTQNSGANAIIQSGASFSGRPYESNVIWKSGVTGKGEVVAVGDTGIDHDNCLFIDPDRQIPIDRIDHSHRKIVGYLRMEMSSDERIVRADTKDGIDGHGTHVAGSVAGAVLQGHPNSSTISKFNGVAPDAKLLFLDFQNDNYPGLIIPDDLYEGYLQRIYSAGVRISSNSWGCTYGGLWKCKYDCQCTWTQDTRFGRKGQSVSNSWCMKQLDGLRCCEFCNRYDTQAQETDRFLHENDDMIVLFASGNEGAESSSGSVGSPATAKNVLTVGASMNNNDAFLESIHHMDFREQLKIQNLGSTGECCRYRNADVQKEKAVKMLCCPDYIREQYVNNPSYFEQRNMASFSSRGPVSGDGRIKPDVVAPGYMIQSARSDGIIGTNQCGIDNPQRSNSAAILTMKGTSMATPITAGSVALIRQYYREFYRFKLSNPSGMLLKATVIHSAQRMAGKVDLDGQGNMKDLPDVPNIYNGFGLIQLNKVLEFSKSPFHLYVENKKIFRMNGQSHTLCLKNRGQKDNAELKATLTWYDPASSLQGQLSLINNIHLSVTAMQEDGTIIRRVDNNDGVNNVRQAVLSLNKGETAKIVVSAYSLQQAPQAWALVITADKAIGTC